MGRFNDGKPLSKQVKPFGFMVAPMARTGAWSETDEPKVLADVKRGRPTKPKSWKPIAPFERDASKAAEQAFDRETGEPVPVEDLKTYAETLALFHLSPEDKFENGAPFDQGPTRRRHVFATEVALIGKEANKVGEFGNGHPVSEAVVEFSWNLNSSGVSNRFMMPLA